MSLSSVGSGGQDKSLTETHRHPLALLNAKVEPLSQPEQVQHVRGRRPATLKNPTHAGVWKWKCLQLGCGRGHPSCLWCAAGKAIHLGHWARCPCSPCTSRSASRDHQHALSCSARVDTTTTYKVAASPLRATQISLQATHSEAARVTVWAGMRSARLGHLLTAAHWLL